MLFKVLLYPFFSLQHAYCYPKILPLHTYPQANYFTTGPTDDAAAPGGTDGQTDGATASGNETTALADGPSVCIYLQRTMACSGLESVRVQMTAR